MRGPHLISLLLLVLVAGSLAAPPTYYPFGPQADVPETSLIGWRRCWNTSYATEDAGETNVTAMYVSCSGDYLLYGCRKDGATHLTVLAAGQRTAVLNDTGNTNDYPTSVTTNNGVDWYYNLESAIGFAKAGDAILKDSCDSINGSYPDLKLCWVAGNENKYLYGGYRCGSATEIYDGWTREIWVPDPCGNKKEGDACNNGNSCTVNTCKSGVCVSGSAVTCEVPDGCLSSTCNAKTGECQSFCPDPEGTPIENKLTPKSNTQVSSGSVLSAIILNIVFIFVIIVLIQ